MKRAIAIADRIALPAMWLVAMLHLLFLASLLAIMVVAPASSQPACAGADLFTELKRSDPVKLAAIEAKAAKTPNGDAILWRIERDGRSAQGV
jgi:cytochrome bd-type quinol oxidase subunit 1